MKKVVVVDDHPLVAAGIAKLFEGLKGYVVIGVFNHPSEALQKIIPLRPDIVMVDLEMPIINGFELIELIRSKGLETKFVLLTIYLNQAVVKKAMEIRVDGYLPKQAKAYELKACLESIKEGNQYFSQKALEVMAKPAKKIEKTGLKKTQLLTNREREILQLIVNGDSTKRIAEKLFIAVRTVETHRKSILEKLEVNNVAGMVRIAVKEGFTD